MNSLGTRTMRQASKHTKRPSGKLTAFARASAQADAILKVSVSVDPKPEVFVVSRRAKRTRDLSAELNAARARVEAMFAQPGMDTDAIRRRIDRSAKDQDQPFTVMAGVSR